MTEPRNLVSDAATLVERGLDTKTAEVLALAAFRALFADGIRMPLKMKDVIDMELVARDNNVFLNMNQVLLHAPELVIWRFTFTYQGHPVIEYGRGVKDGMKIHFPRLCVLLMAIWRDKRKTARAKARSDAARDRQLANPPMPHPNVPKGEDTSA
ncbi:MAG: hypothetical protein HKL79_02525 [Thermoplasmata archaeon]|nr:hypothetical protein [Thermoplasmata archaeon]